MSARQRTAFVLAALVLACTGSAQASRDGDRHGRDHRSERDDRDSRRDRSGGSITVYEHADFRGRSQSFDRGIRNLQQVGMNDMISSVQVRGTWEVCEHADFRGRCETIGRDVRNFEHIRMNDQISSLRPVETRRRGR